jgi:Transposase, Mutator family
VFDPWLSRRGRAAAVAIGAEILDARLRASQPAVDNLPRAGKRDMSTRLVVADGAPGLIKAVEQCWPASDRQHCSVHRVRKLPKRERDGSARPTGGHSIRPSTSAAASRVSAPLERERMFATMHVATGEREC